MPAYNAKSSDIYHMKPMVLYTRFNCNYSLTNGFNLANFRNLVPDNIISATFMMEYTALVPNNPQNLSMGYKKERERTFKTNILGLCVFSLILGFVLFDLGDQVKTVKTILEETNIIIMRILRSFIVYVLIHYSETRLSLY